jgi:hypothetical protein
MPSFIAFLSLPAAAAVQRRRDTIARKYKGLFQGRFIDGADYDVNAP